MHQCVRQRGVALAVALWVCAPATASVVYVDIVDRLVDRIPVTLDLNMDGVNDFSVFRTDGIATSFFGVTESSRVLRASQGSQFTAFLTEGTPIEDDPAFDQLSLLAEELCEVGACAWFGPFPQAGVPGFIGVEFLIDGMPHYGWVRAFVARATGVAILFDYAYETRPKTTILAGQLPAPGAAMTLGAGLLIAARRRR